MGPVYSLIVRFQGMKCGREVIPGHANRVLGGAIRVIDLVIITRDEAGELVKVGAKTWKDRGVTPSGGRRRHTDRGVLRRRGRGLRDRPGGEKRCHSPAVRKCPGHPRRGSSEKCGFRADRHGRYPSGGDPVSRESDKNSMRCPRLRGRMLMPPAGTRASRNRPRREMAQSEADGSMPRSRQRRPRMPSSHRPSHSPHCISRARSP